MKTINKLIFFALAIVFFSACKQNYIDDISKVDPGADEAAPVVTMTYPTNGMEVNTQNDVSLVNIQFEVSDDIELGHVEVELDDSPLASYDSFNDYRILKFEYPIELGLGSHVLIIKATDLSGKNTTETINFMKVNTIRELMSEAIFYMDFNGDYVDNVSFTSATVVGTPSIITSNAVDGSAYKGATDSYLTFPGDGLHSTDFSASFFLNINATPDRAGILVMSPEDLANPDAQIIRSSGFRFFRENGGGLQQFKLNVGNGTTDTWFDGGTAAQVDPATTDWVHFVFTISSTECVVYINGEVVSKAAFTGIDWTGCDLLSIMSGAPRFTGWNHLSDESMMDELLIYNRVLTQDEIDLLGLLLN